MHRTLRYLGLAMIVIGVTGSYALSADWMPHFWRRPCPPTHSERLERAGNPFCLSKWARCSEEKYDRGYYVGGGAAKGGDIRYWHEGTWGWDYDGPGSHVELGWFHGRRYQSGEGQYEPDEKNRPFAPERQP
ncbi:hypothetical protein GC163_06770 [bacterium]|nr:hypothetical protein [bacterium]